MRNPFQRHYQIKVQHIFSTINIDRQTIFTPRKGYRARLVRVRLVQAVADGRHLWELFFGTAGNIITAPNQTVDILAVKDLSSTATRTFLKNEGPRGKRDEVLSGRWRGVAPLAAHHIIIEYQEET